MKRLKLEIMVPFIKVLLWTEQERLKAREMHCYYGARQDCKAKSCKSKKCNLDHIHLPDDPMSKELK